MSNHEAPNSYTLSEDELYLQCTVILAAGTGSVTDAVKEKISRMEEDATEQAGRSANGEIASRNLGRIAVLRDFGILES